MHARTQERGKGLDALPSMQRGRIQRGRDVHFRREMNAPEETHIVAEGAIDHLRDLQRVLRTAGIEAQITSPPAAKCSS